MAVQKKQPVRKCMGCNAQKLKKELIRIVRSPEGEISIDPKGKKSGRGAYICHDKTCLAKVKKSKRLNKIFEVEIPDAIYVTLEAELEAELLNERDD